jgi:hypothetical protein
VSEVVHIGLIKLLNLRFHHIVISPHGNGTNDGMPASCNKSREVVMARLEAKLDGHQGEINPLKPSECYMYHMI